MTESRAETTGSGLGAAPHTAQRKLKVRHKQPSKGFAGVCHPFRALLYTHHSLLGAHPMSLVNAAA